MEGAGVLSCSRPAFAGMESCDVQALKCATAVVAGMDIEDFFTCYKSTSREPDEELYRVPDWPTAFTWGHCGALQPLHQVSPVFFACWNHPHVTLNTCKNSRCG